MMPGVGGRQVICYAVIAASMPQSPRIPPVVKDGRQTASCMGRAETVIKSRHGCRPDFSETGRQCRGGVWGGRTRMSKRVRCEEQSKKEGGGRAGSLGVSRRFNDWARPLKRCSANYRT